MSSPELAGPTIILAGQKYVILELAIREKKVIEPLLHKLRKAYLSKAEGESKEIIYSEEEIDDLIKIVYTAVKRGLPHLQYEDFLNLKTSTKELTNAIPVIVSQGGWKPASPGEGKGAENPLSPIGIK